MIVSWLFYTLFFAMFISACLFHFGIVLICYISLLILQFCAEYFGLYGYNYVNQELRDNVSESINSCRKRLKETSEVYNYFYN